MLIELSTDLFPSPPSTIELNALAHLALTGRHRLIISDDRDPAFLKWLGSLSDDHQMEWRLILTEGYELESREPARRELKVTANGPADWSISPPTLSLSNAVVYLQLPFIAMLEDWSSDRAFLLAVSTPEQSSYLLKMEERNALQFANGGGITNMPKQIISHVSNPGGAYRLWSLFDGDGMQPAMPSRDSERMRQTCEKAGVPHKQLSRRSIENYLPEVILGRWAQLSRNERMKKFRAFSRMRLEQKSHYNMKDGFHQDSKRTDASAGSLFDDLHENSKNTLQNGFGGQIAELFINNHVSESILRDSGSWDEINGFVSELVELVR